MEVLRYRSSDGHVDVRITTGSIRSSWYRFNARIDGGASNYCDYKSTKPGLLYLTDFRTFDDEPRLLNEENQTGRHLSGRYESGHRIRTRWSQAGPGNTE